MKDPDGFVTPVLVMLLLGCASVATGCRSSSPPEGPSSLPSAASQLGGTSWRLITFRGGDDTVLAPRTGAIYTIEFGADGELSIRVDCNRGRGSWKSSGPNQLEFGPLALTRAFCADPSLHDQIVKQWGFIRSYVLSNGHLFLSLMADGGTYEFEPERASAAK